MRRWSIRFETLTYDVEDGIALIRLNRPERLNAVNSVMSRELPQVWKAFREDRSAVVAIVTAAGSPAFCTGADVADLPEMITDAEGNAQPESVRWTAMQNDVWKPVICAVSGDVMGGGLHFIAESDVVIASDMAMISDPHVSIGLTSAIETIALARRIPIGAVLRLALGGRGVTLSADRAHELGMFDEICPAEQVLGRAMALAGEIRRNSPSAMEHTKRAIWSSKSKGLDEALVRAWDAINAQARSPDFKEGVAAFNERRAPQWTPLS
ncbi:enoyl-CoA hydratase/isomerase family protein [Erythrobacter aurantius]|uniref:enoyl-CoA hydratase/isomerase family protein n=1 Tax=Erythrobacter aurantius TaxID=2909249 RepID=UPI00207A6D76|nr:enoyl-CoA hydratase/isomerase family protein [Erythrobacter aurantius]